MGRWHLERNGFITKSDLPEVSRQRPSSVTASLLLKGNGTNGAQNNTFIDSSANNFTITRNGNVTQGGFTPFLPANTEYDPATHGGSGYFDGVGDSFLVTSANLQLGTSDFTLEFWWYTTSVGTSDVEFLRHNQSTQAVGIGIYNFATDIGIVNFVTGSMFVNFGPKTQIPTNQWVHIAITRSGNDFRCFINGVITSSGVRTSSATLTNSTSNEYRVLNALPASYVSNYRVVTGSALYTSNFTPPTAPLTAITNTSLLLNFTNAGIIDSTGKNVLETVGNAQVDTTTKKYGTGAMEFDGSGDFLFSPYSPEIDLLTGSFTIEGWIYTTNLKSGGQRIFSTGGGTVAWNSTTGIHVLFQIQNGTGILSLQLSSNTTTPRQFNSTGTVSANTWTHVAAVYDASSTTIRLFINGTMESSSITAPARPSTNPVLNVATIPGENGAVNENFQGFIDDLRITKGAALYTSNFTPPAAELSIGPFEVPTFVTNNVYGVKKLAPIASLVSYIPVKSPAAAGFVPTDLATLRAWYDAADTSTVTIVSGVSEWRDKSGNNYHVSQGNTSLQPAYTSGQFLTFNNDYLASTSHRYGLGANPDLTILVVIKVTGGQDGNFLQIGGPTTTTNLFRVNASTLDSTSGRFGWRYNNGNELYNAAINGQTYIASFYHPAGGNYASSGLLLDGAEVSPTSSANPTFTTSNTANYVYLGSGGSLASTAAFYGTISEIVILESVDTTERQKVEGYLAHKWGLTANLPSGHPYKTIAP